MGIEVLLGQRVDRIDVAERSLECKSSSLNFDGLVLATGSKPAIPPIDGCAKRGVIAIKTLQDIDRMMARLSHKDAKRAVIVGSGPVGLEVAVGLRKRGLEVCVIELLERIMPRLLDEKPALILRSLLEQFGVEVITGERVESIRGRRSVKGVATAQREMDCDLVCIAVGMRPRIELAREAGIALGSLGGVLVSEEMQTNIADIYACGDCVETEDVVTGENCLSLLWHTAKQQGYVAGCNLIGEHRRYQGSLNFAVLEVFGTYVVSSGHTWADFRGDEAQVIEAERNGSYEQFIIKGERLVGLQYMGTAPSPDLGLLLGAIRRKSRFRELKGVD